jgi:RHS repeat-associated protein
MDALVGQTTDRGYTEHEHLDEVGVIHMNGRVYDPLVGRFMSADPFVPNPYNLQSFNRYSYVRNNPLGLYDPSGYLELPPDVNTNPDYCWNQPGGCYTPPTPSPTPPIPTYTPPAPAVTSGTGSSGSTSGGGGGSSGAGGAAVCPSCLNGSFGISVTGSNQINGIPVRVGTGVSPSISDIAIASVSRWNIFLTTLTLSGSSNKVGEGDDSKIYATYTRIGPDGRVYSGRTSGRDDPFNLVYQRGQQQSILTAEGYTLPVLDQWSQSKDAIRGREQMLIDYFGGAQSVGGSARNMINGVSDFNLNRSYYINLSVSNFGSLSDNSPKRFRLSN